MSKIPLLFLPGLLCDTRLWSGQAEALADVATPHFADLTLDDSIEAMARRILREAPERFALAALSMGGYVAFAVARLAPERVLKLALFATNAAPDDEAALARRRAELASLKLGKFVGVTPQLLPRIVHPDHAEGAVGETVRDMARIIGKDAFVRQQTAVMARPDARPHLKALSVPVLAATGQQDRITPLAQAREIHLHVPGSRYEEIERCGHLPPLEAPDRTERLLREWLAE